MKFIPINDNSDNLHRGLTADQIIMICQRTFGTAMQIESARDISNGTFNSVYLITLQDQSKAVLRVAPPPAADRLWFEQDLMRREYQILPFFTAIAAFMPTVILADFTHQLIDRDYMVQSFIEGERWDHIEDELTPDESLALWQQLGRIVKQIHSTTGEMFGWPTPGPQYTTWSRLIIDELERIIDQTRQSQLDPDDILTALNVIQSQTALLDQVRRPCLLHGDLWPFNILVTRPQDSPKISGILDADRAWWGDPMADWLIFLFYIRRDEPEWDTPRAAFWQGYGQPPDRSQAAQFREVVYETMHLGVIRLWSWQNGNANDIVRANDEISQSLRRLQTKTS